jgi:hypothetical protein
MDERGLSLEALERRALEAALPLKLRNVLVTPASVSSHFEAHRADYDRLTYLALSGPDGPEARAFLEASAALWRARPPQKLPALKTIWRRDADDCLRARLFDQLSLGVTSVVEGPEGPLLLHVLSRQPATLDAATESLIREVLFREALAQRRQRAVVEWNWGCDEIPR